MIQLKKKGKYSDVLNDVRGLLSSRINFYYAQKITRRFFYPMYFIYDSRSPDISDIHMDRDIALFNEAMIDVIDRDLLIVGYKDSVHGFVVAIGSSEPKLIDAIKCAKAFRKPKVVDLRTSKLFDSNG